MISRVLLLIGIIALTFSVDRRVGLLLLAFAGLVIVLLRPLQRLAVPHFRAARQVSAELASFLEERFSSREDIYGLDRPPLPLPAIQQLLGHADIAITTIYTRVSADDLARMRDTSEVL
jgi:ATP-binding cassette subfamily B protein